MKCHNCGRPLKRGNLCYACKDRERVLSPKIVHEPIKDQVIETKTYEDYFYQAINRGQTELTRYLDYRGKIKDPSRLYGVYKIKIE